MTVQAIQSEPISAIADTIDAHEEHHDDGSTTTLGFWIYLMSDCVLFAALFCAFAVLRTATAGGPAAKDLFDLSYVAVETTFLLVSSFTYGMAMISAEKKRQSATLVWLGLTMLMGLGFMGMELHEFAELIEKGAGPDRSAFLSSFFTLVGTHGLHVTAGMIWMVTLVVHVLRRGLTEQNITRLTCLSLFWHFLDIVWICVFTVVYLMGFL